LAVENAPALATESEGKQTVDFRPNLLIHAKKFPSPTQTTSSQGVDQDLIKVIDLRNPHIRKLVMNSLNEIIEERKKHSRA